MLGLSPLVLLALVLAALAALLSVPTSLPIGSMYWDLVVYLDGANRVLDGQVPSIDFFAPVGPLGYWLFAMFERLFPVGQPLLVVQWSLLVVTAPLLALVLAEVDRRSRPLAFALLVPFLVFSILPVNVEEFYPYPGVDGFGIYNRQVCHVLYVLAAALVFSKRQALLVAAIAGAMLALFLVKITGFIAGLMLCAMALLAGRLALRTVLAAMLAFAAVLTGLEVAFGVVSAYLADIAALLTMNEESLLPRFLQAASIHFGPFVAAVALCIALLVLTQREIRADARAALTRRDGASLARLFDRDVLWLAVATFAGLFFETQNTGGQAFIFLWPILLPILTGARRWRGGALALVVGLSAAVILPTAVQVVHRTARALIGQVRYVELESANLKTLGQVSQRAEVMTRSRAMIDVYRRFPAIYDQLAAMSELPAFTLYSEPDFQLTWLETVDEAVGAIRAYEAREGVRFETIMSLNFVNPFPWLLDRHATRLIAIGADPYRAVPNPSPEIMAAVSATDLILYPKCPVTSANLRLMDIYRPGLGHHAKVALSPCWDAYLRDSLPRSGAAAALRR